MNKEGYIKKEDRKKILLLCDDIRAHSGVAHMGRELVANTAHRYNWVNLGGSVKHPDEGKRFDLCESTNEHIGMEDASVFIYPISGYGSPEVLRGLLKSEKPDAIFIITDPRYWVWLFEMESEVRTRVPIVYLNIWDNYPAPMYNKTFYESCDALLGISKQTVNINRLVLGERGDNKLIEYVPHGIDPKVFHPLTKDELEDKEYILFVEKMKKEKDIDFVVFFNSRNIRRKQIPDTILAYKHFVDGLPKGKKEKTLLLLHTSPVDGNGTDLEAVIDLLAPVSQGYNIHFTYGSLPPAQMNWLYSMSDVSVLLSSNEGWGLSLTESLLTGTPFIANVTGGMQDQMRFVKDGKWMELDADFPSNHRGTVTEHGSWAFPVYPTSRSMIGSPTTPYIWDDRCEPEDAASRMTEVYSLTKEERIRRGVEGIEWACSQEAGFTSAIMGQRIIDNMDKLFSTWTPREKFELILAGDLEENNVQHKLIY